LFASIATEVNSARKGMYGDGGAVPTVFGLFSSSHCLCFRCLEFEQMCWLFNSDFN